MELTGPDFFQANRSHSIDRLTGPANHLFSSVTLALQGVAGNQHPIVQSSLKEQEN